MEGGGTLEDRDSPAPKTWQKRKTRRTDYPTCTSVAGDRHSIIHVLIIRATDLERVVFLHPIIPTLFVYFLQLLPFSVSNHFGRETF